MADIKEQLERLKEKGYIYNFDQCHFVHEDTFSKDGLNGLDAPPFVLTDEKIAMVLEK